MIMVSVVIAVLGMLMGALVGVGFTRERYYDPKLHEGAWQMAETTTTHVTWKRTAGAQREAPHAKGQCMAWECTIMRGTEHVDTCSCGKKRYGVFGSWS